MQQIFLFFTMLITASEAFLNGSHISTNNKKKISGFVPNARTLKSVDPVFGNMGLPIKINTEPEMISPREVSTFLSLCARHKRFSNDGRSSLKELDNVGFLRNGKFLNRRRNRRLRSMRRKRKLIPSFPTANTMNGNSYLGRENSSVPSFSSLFDFPVNLDKFYGKVSYPKSRSKVSKQKQINDYLPFNFKQLSSNFKSHRRVKSGNVKKRKRDAETVNVSQANVTKHVKEKDLDEESNDSLDDSYPQDSRPEFPTQHLDDTTSSWQKYFEPNSQQERPYLQPPTSDDIDYYDSVLDIPSPSVCLSRMNFPIPYDRRIYEDTSFEDDDNDAKFFRKSESEDIIKNDRQKKRKKKKGKKSDSPRLEKLKLILDDVESALKEENGSSKSKMSRKGGKPGDSENAIRSKIEVVIPLLSQIYQELGQRPTHLHQTTVQMKSKPSEGQEEGNEVKQNEKQCSDCNLDGVWLSNVMGLAMNVTTQPNLMLKVCIMPVKKDAPIDDSWSMHGLTLAKTGGPFVLAAISPGKKKIASFIGQCWICEDQEYVYGSWTILTEEEKIPDLLTAISTKLDVLTRKKDKDEVT